MSEETETLEKIVRGDYLYLAHPRESRLRVREWEVDFEKRTGIVLLNPFYEIARKNREIDLNETDPRTAHKALDKTTVKEELAHLKRSKGMVTIVDGNYTIGTFMEMVYAYEIYGKPVYTLATNGYDLHPWLIENSTEIFTNRNVMEGRLINLYFDMGKAVLNG